MTMIHMENKNLKWSVNLDHTDMITNDTMDCIVHTDGRIIAVDGPQEILIDLSMF